MAQTRRTDALRGTDMLGEWAWKGVVLVHVCVTEHPKTDGPVSVQIFLTIRNGVSLAAPPQSRTSRAPQYRHPLTAGYVLRLKAFFIAALQLFGCWIVAGRDGAWSEKKSSSFSFSGSSLEFPNRSVTTVDLPQFENLKRMRFVIVYI